MPKPTITDIFDRLAELVERLEVPLVGRRELIRNDYDCVWPLAEVLARNLGISCDDDWDAAYQAFRERLAKA
jgi:hypothetical protein